MKITDAGHSYLLDNFESGAQSLKFVKKNGSGFPFNFGTQDGTKCQEVLRALIDRCEYLNKQKPCAETEAIIGNLQSALLLFELRAARRHDRQLSLQSLGNLSCDPVCEKCLHIGCRGTCR